MNDAAPAGKTGWWTRGAKHWPIRCHRFETQKAPLSAGLYKKKRLVLFAVRQYLDDVFVNGAGFAAFFAAPIIICVVCFVAVQDEGTGFEAGAY